MDPKTVTTIIIVCICVLLFPLAIGIIGGIFGVIGSVIGGLFGLIGGVFGIIMGVIGAFLGAIFGVFGWIFDGEHRWGHHGINFFNRDVFALIIVVIVVLMISRSRATRTGR
jgi:hypothetical protein